MKELTRSEEQVMQILWKLEKGFVNDIVELMPDPKPAYNTVSTVIRILENKHFVAHKAYGKTHEYYPLISKDEYSGSSLNRLVNNYFDNSYHSLASFFAKNGKMTVAELETIKKMIDEELTHKNDKK